MVLVKHKELPEVLWAWAFSSLFRDPSRLPPIFQGFKNKCFWWASSDSNHRSNRLNPAVSYMQVKTSQWTVVQCTYRALAAILHLQHRLGRQKLLPGLPVVLRYVLFYVTPSDRVPPYNFMKSALVKYQAMSVSQIIELLLWRVKIRQLDFRLKLNIRQELFFVNRHNAGSTISGHNFIK